MILIADSSALISLAIVDKLDILEKIFGKVYVPKAVYFYHLMLVLLVFIFKMSSNS